MSTSFIFFSVETTEKTRKFNFCGKLILMTQIFVSKPTLWWNSADFKELTLAKTQRWKPKDSSKSSNKFIKLLSSISHSCQKTTIVESSGFDAVDRYLFVLAAQVDGANVLERESG